MADLEIRSQSQSWLRGNIDRLINITFPLWGILFPIFIFAAFTAICGSLQMGKTTMITEQVGFFVLFVMCTTATLLLKRALANDYLVVNKHGITLPGISGGKIGWKKHISWQKVTKITASIDSDKADRSSLNIFKEKGRRYSLAIKDIEPDFVEQLLLAVRMWAPEKCDDNLETLQNSLRIGARELALPSYTDLWEDELRRRFCPTQYVPLEPDRVLRNSSLKVVRQLATGGLSALYLCQLDGNRLVVLKEAAIPPQGSDELKEKARELFAREAQLLLKVDHPGIVHVLDTFSEFGRNYMILEYVSGTDMWQLVRQNGPQKESDVIEWAIQIANTLKYLHDREQPIVHRDITPDNIILRNDGKVVLVDFGAANEFIGTATGTFVGKHSFIAPEQLRGKATVQSDIYAFGCTLYFLLLGHEPEALSPSDIKADLPAERTAISDELCDLVMSCTQLEAADRYQNVAQLLPVLKRMAAQSVL